MKPDNHILTGKPGVAGERFLTKKALCQKVGVTFPCIWRMIREGNFPKGRAVGSRTLWISSEIDAWILARPARVYRKSAERVDGVHSHKSTAEYATGAR
jgi:prophage regulatory protein